MSRKPQKTKQELEHKIQVRKNRIMRKPRPTDFPVPVIIEELEKNEGSISKTAREFNLGIMQLTTYCDSVPELRNHILGYREDLLDLAEEKLREHLNASSLRAIMFTLKTLGRNRGFVERDEQIRTNVNINAPAVGVDLSKLSTEQLQSLSDIMQSQAKDDPTMIEVEATIVDP